MDQWDHRPGVFPVCWGWGKDPFVLGRTQSDGCLSLVTQLYEGVAIPSYRGRYWICPGGDSSLTEEIQLCAPSRDPPGLGRDKSLPSAW